METVFSLFLWCSVSSLFFSLSFPFSGDPLNGNKFFPFPVPQEKEKNSSSKERPDKSSYFCEPGQSCCLCSLKGRSIFYQKQRKWRKFWFHNRTFKLLYLKWAILKIQYEVNRIIFQPLLGRLSYSNVCFMVQCPVLIWFGCKFLVLAL